MSSLVNTSSKIDISGSSGQNTTKEQLKMAVFAGTKTFDNLKLKNGLSDIAKTCSLYVPPLHLLKTEGVNQREGTSKKAIKKC